MKKIYVDGNKIRNHLDIECPPLARRQADPTCYNTRIYIPPNEIWIDHSYIDESEELLSWENELKNLVGRDYLAKRDEKVKQLQELRNKKNISRTDYLIKETKSDDVTRVYVKGSIIRKYFDPDFIFGGHHYVYSYIPQNEIWLDVTVDPEEIPFVYLHEKIERDLMKEGKNYDQGHEIALCLEKNERRNNGACYPGDINYQRPNQDLSSYFKFQPN